MELIDVACIERIYPAQDLHVFNEQQVIEKMQEKRAVQSFGAKDKKIAGSEYDILLEDQVEFVTNEVLAGSAGHNEYWVPGTESMRNLALIEDRGLVLMGTIDECCCDRRDARAQGA